MTASRSPKQEKIYKKYTATIDKDVCVFCGIDKGSDQYITETAYFKVIRNIFPYSLWDGQGVKDHLMITPKAHTPSLAAMTDTQKAEYVDLLERYEGMGYNIYSRAPASKIKSVFHQHTHLILPDDSIRSFVLFIRKPYIRIGR